MASRPTTIATGFLLTGVFLCAAIAFAFFLLPRPELPLSACTDVGYAGDSGGFEYYEYSWLWVAYSPDGGVNRCSTPIVTIAVGCFVVGSSLLGIERYRG
ncbi:hypothetical protein [Natronobacterium gregoryi]|uniref:Uncharacterized protein n=2 Tax=Natronobacterium gregoryi TaxID=44930 RepID=L0AK27_NATGS|nr:hypothetical protein [Natronobacterium gregoryi]AFZ74131.1 hypothetical protein Natgr_2996 [Natronobacterium gregoryi SP2]ELY63868.1 hypothetical protein C490_15082 [Natronobacterium gregoryi SP2]PLK22074.1 hypothetical protein CYV19_01400 [Natronobacterium gregoryi SP2]SFI50033.1 hypothetical protein SAMN05443661_10116 [Natronobacterium gregoryi]